MQPRHTVTELFSTFMQFQSDCFSGWQTDARLQRSMQTSQKDMTNSTESFWVSYWYQVWQTRSLKLAGEHLIAYLQEPCYWASQRVLQKFTTPLYRLSDYFQMAIGEANAVLEHFKPTRGASLKTFASLAFYRLLKDILRQRQEIEICTHWTLLRKVSRKRFLEVLRLAGLSSETIAEYYLAWTCFNSLYTPTQASGKLSLPTPDLWQAIAQLYNTERETTHLLAPVCSPTQIEGRLTQVALWIRSYLYPPIDSLNTPRYWHETGEIQDTLADQMTDSLLTNLLEQEELQTRQEQQIQVNTFLQATLDQLDPHGQKMLRLYYREGLTQQQIVQKLGISQASVSRQLTKTREHLLLRLIDWSQTTLNISPNPNLIKQMSSALEEWLVTRYSELDPSLSASQAQLCDAIHK